MAKISSTPPATQENVPEAPRSDTPGDAPDNNLPSDVAGVSATDTSSQKRGRGRPPKAKSGSKNNDAVSAKPSRKPSGRPKRNVAPAVPTASAAAVVKPTRGRATRSNPPPVSASQVTTSTVDGSRKRGRPKRDDVAAATVAPAKKRGRKPNVEVVAAAKPVRRTRKSTSVAPPVAASNIGDLKKKTALLKKKVKEAAAKLKIAVTAINEVQEIVDGM